MQYEKYTDNLIKHLRVYVTDQPGFLGSLTQTIGRAGGNLGDIRLIKRAGRFNFREVEVYVRDEEHLNDILHAIGQLEGIQIDSVSDAVLDLHRGGKIEMRSKVAIESAADLRRIYTPGVAAVCRTIQADPRTAWDYTYLSQSVAIVTNGTAILGLGDIGPLAGMPVMEGKAVLFSHLVGLSGIPILIDSHDVDECVDTIVRISNSFGAIKLEDFGAPECFEIERKLMEKLEKPVMHDDQHGTATVTLAALLNACKYAGVQLKNEVVGIVGLGAAGTGIANLLKAYGVKHLIGSDLRQDAKDRMVAMGGEVADLKGLMEKASVVVSTTGVKNLIKPEMVRKRQIILALSNPDPEIRPEVALEAGAAFAADGRGVNNALAFPGIFKGALSARAKMINNRMKIAAAQTIARFADSDRQDLVPPLLNLEVHKAVSAAVERAAFESGAVHLMPGSHL
jgi:malate dehydrogenase (oxaloacetate-decarboxylating)